MPPPPPERGWSGDTAGSKMSAEARPRAAGGRGDVRELVELAALLLVGGLELLVLQPESLLLQHDLLVQAGRTEW